MPSVGMYIGQISNSDYGLFHGNKKLEWKKKKYECKLESEDT